MYCLLKRICDAMQYESISEVRKAGLGGDGAQCAQTTRDFIDLVLVRIFVQLRFAGFPSSLLVPCFLEGGIFRMHGYYS